MHFAWDNNLERIECYDVAHLAGISQTASMVTFINAEADKTLYRHFRIRQKNTRSDTDSLTEIARRREKHLTSWGIPNLIIIDGGKGQISSFLKHMSKHNIPIIGITKRNETLVIPIKENGKIQYRNIKLTKGYALNLVQRVRNEAHRFAQRYHHSLLKKELFTK